jgi:hypothetical protein
VSRFRIAFPSLIVALLAAEAFAGGQTGIPAKRPVFGGACRLCPWGAMAEVLQAAMKPYGCDVQICYNCNAADAPRIVSEARMPPPYRPEILAPRNAPVLGPVDFGALAIQLPAGREHEDRLPVRGQGTEEAGGSWVPAAWPRNRRCSTIRLLTSTTLADTGGTTGPHGAICFITVSCRTCGGRSRADREGRRHP